MVWVEVYMVFNYYWYFFCVYCEFGVWYVVVGDSGCGIELYLDVFCLVMESKGGMCLIRVCLGFGMGLGFEIWIFCSFKYDLKG